MPSEPRYTYEELAAACAESRTTSEIVRRLGRVLSPSRTRTVLRLLREWDIDHDHLDLRARRYSKDLLTEAASVSDSINDVLRCLDIPVTGGSATHIGRQLRAFEIDITHFTFQKQRQPTELRELTRSELKLAVAAVATRRGLLRQLDIPWSERTRRHVDSECVRHSIDTSHLARSWPDITMDELCAAVSTSASIPDTMTVLGMAYTKKSEGHVASVIDRLGIDTAHFTEHSCPTPRPTSTRWIPAARILLWDPSATERPNTGRLRRALIEIGVRYVCVGCGIGPEWRGRPITLEIDHINGDITDNRRENLQVLCPNCHAITATYGRKKRAATP